MNVRRNDTRRGAWKRRVAILALAAALLLAGTAQPLPLPAPPSDSTDLLPFDLPAADPPRAAKDIVPWLLSQPLPWSNRSLPHGPSAADALGGPASFTARLLERDWHAAPATLTQAWRLALDPDGARPPARSEEHTSELQSLAYLVC